MLVHKTKIPVRFGDTDPYGVVYFVAYFRYFHEGIEEFLNHIGITPGNFFRNTEEKFGMPKVAADCHFFVPAFYGDELEMHTSIKEVKEKAIVFQFHSVSFVCIDHTWKSRPLPDILVEKIKESS
jgi:YbgC/YbaW family acyl-CoA thioester hydrolase